MQTQRLRIAIQKKGRLSKECQELLKKCGVKFNIMGERLVVHSLNMPIDLLLVRDDDIPGLIMDGVVDLGFVGENVLEETRLDRKALNQPSEFVSLRRMDFGGCRLSIAIDKELPYNISVAVACLSPSIKNCHTTAHKICVANALQPPIRNC